jgi:hypothetical protein
MLLRAIRVEKGSAIRNTKYNKVKVEDCEKLDAEQGGNCPCAAGRPGEPYSN